MHAIQGSLLPYYITVSRCTPAATATLFTDYNHAIYTYLHLLIHLQQVLSVYAHESHLLMKHM